MLGRAAHRGLIVGSDLRELISDGVVFRVDSSVATQVRHSAYDLRVARDLCIIPANSAVGERAHQRYMRGQYGPRSFELLPGESAFVSTRERVHIPWDISANVGSKFSMAAKGLLILTGSVVDPGFGMVPSSAGSWQKCDDQRLHFVIANVGPEPINVGAESDSVATIQFYSIAEVPHSARREVESVGFLSIEEAFFNDPIAAPVLAYFRQVTDLRRDVDAMAELSERNARRAESAVQGVNTVVLFGVYLLAVTIVGVLFATFTEGAAKLIDSRSWWVRGVAIGGLGTALLSIIAVTFAVVRAFSKSFAD